MIIIIIAILLLINPLPVFSEEGCIDCHSKKGGTINFDDSSLMDVSVDTEQLKLSVHSNLQCPDCHSDITLSDGKHPERRFRSREHFKIRTSLLCRRCHPPQDIKTKKIHEQLFMDEERGTPHPCTNCHGSHGVMPVKKKLYRDEEAYCLSCHRSNYYIKIQKW